MKCILVTFLCIGISLSACRSTKENAALARRPSFHFAPAKNWMNDPNGLIYYQGHYHLYYQHNPYADKWGHMSWGHAISTDLIKWQDQPVAIPEFANQKGDTTMIFSGSAVIDSLNTTGWGTAANRQPLIAVYTANVMNKRQLAQYQNIAYSLDGNRFTQYERNPVVDIGSKEFRDPKVFWYKPGQQWMLLAVKPDRKKVMFYKSLNLKEWTYLGDFGGMGDTMRIWECPDLFEMPVQNEPGKTKWLLTVSSGHPVKGYPGMQYFIGDFNGKTFTADSLQYPCYLDYGKDFYAGIIFNALKPGDDRKIMVGWADCWEYADDIPSNGSRGMASVPRNLQLIHKDGNYMITQQPVKELDAYLTNVVYEHKMVSLTDSTLSLARMPGNAYKMELDISETAEQAGIALLRNQDETTSILFNRSGHTLQLDRQHSGETTFSNKFTGVDSLALSPGIDSLHLTILVDEKLVEVFVNNGEKVISNLVFPKHMNGEVALFSKGKSVFKNIIITAPLK